MSTQPETYPFLTREAGLIFRITHVANLPWILDHGLHCRNSALLDPDFQDIGNAELIAKRAPRPVPVEPGGTLQDYVAFYFTPGSPMLLNILTGRNVPARAKSELIILVSSVPKLVATGAEYVLTDRHAYLALAKFAATPDLLAQLDWKSLRARDFKRRPDDPAHFERYQAEALVYRHFPAHLIEQVVCYREQEAAKVREHAERRGLGINVGIQPGWFF